MSMYPTHQMRPEEVALTIMANVSLGTRVLDRSTIHHLRSILPMLGEEQRDEVEVFLQEEEEDHMRRTWSRNRYSN